MATDQHQSDVLIIGSGASGLSLALQLADHAHVTVISKAELKEGATFYAQGGVSAVLHARDSVEAHIADTLETGCGLCDPDMVRFVVENGRNSIDWLIDLGVNFTRFPDSGGAEYHLHQEGGHSHRRVLHAADSTAGPLRAPWRTAPAPMKTLNYSNSIPASTSSSGTAAAPAPTYMTGSRTG